MDLFVVRTWLAAIGAYIMCRAISCLVNHGGWVVLGEDSGPVGTTEPVHTLIAGRIGGQGGSGVQWRRWLTVDG